MNFKISTKMIASFNVNINVVTNFIIINISTRNTYIMIHIVLLSISLLGLFSVQTRNCLSDYFSVR